MTQQILHALFNHDFSQNASPAAFSAAFFDKTLTLANLGKIHAALATSHYMLDGKPIPAAKLVQGTNSGGAPLLIITQLHGNEPAGLAAVALVLALAEAKLLKRDVLCVIGNPLAAAQYFAHLSAHPHTRQETRDAFRCGLSENGHLLPDMNRIPSDFQTHEPANAHTLRARELYALGLHCSGVLDIHSARGNMLCITDHKHDRELKNTPIRALLTGLAEAISAHASSAVSVRTLKTILQPLPNITAQVGIEAGRHEAPDSPYHAASFTLSFLHTLGYTDAPPLFTEETGIFEGYAVQPRITYADLAHTPATLRAEDRVYMAHICQSLASVPARSDTVIVKQDSGHYTLQSVAEFTQRPAGTMEYALYQYDEMEAISDGQIVAVALPSGTEFRTREAFSGIFFSKSGALYDKDPSVGPWPVASNAITSIKFCYPCRVAPLKLDFN